MMITNVLPVLLICQHLANVHGDFPFFRPNNHPQSHSLQQLTQPLQQIYQPLQQPLIPFQQPNSPQQPLPSFQQTNLPQQIPHLRFQQPFQQLQQFYRPFQQPYPPLQQPTPYINQLLTCPQGTPLCADGRPAICIRHAVTGFPVYYCFNPIPQNGVSWTPGIPGITPSTSVNSVFSGPQSNYSTGERSLFEMLLGSNTDTAPPPTPDTSKPTDQGVNADSEVGNLGPNPSLPNEQYFPSSIPLCSICLLLVGLSAPFQTYKQGQLGYPHLSNYPLPLWSPPGNVLPAASTANVAQPGYLAAHPYPPHTIGPYIGPGFKSHPYPGQGSYQSPGPIPANQQTLNSQAMSHEPKSQDAGLFSMFPEFKNYIFSGSHPLSDHQQHITQLNNPYSPMIRTAPQAHQNPQPFFGGWNNPTYQRKPPFQPVGNPTLFPNLESRQPERPPMLRLLESPGNQPPMPRGVAAIPGSPRTNIPTFQGPQSLAAPQNPLQNPLVPLAQGNLVYQSPEMPASAVQRVQSPLQPGYPSINQLYSPSGPTESQKHPWNLQETPDTKIRNQPNPHFQYPTAEKYTSEKKPQKEESSFQADNPQNYFQSLGAYLSSGLSFFSQLDEEPTRGEKSPKTDDSKRSSVTKRVKKTSNHTRKPSVSGYWL